MGGRNASVGDLAVVVFAWAVPQAVCAAALTWLLLRFGDPIEEPVAIVPALLVSLCATGLATSALRFLLGRPQARPASRPRDDAVSSR